MSVSRPSNPVRPDSADNGRIQAIYMGGDPAPFSLSPRRPVVPKLARQISQLLAQTGTTQEEDLERLRKHRREVAAERYGEQLFTDEELG